MPKKTKQDRSLRETVVAMVQIIVGEVLLAGGTLNHVRRLVNTPALLRQIIGLIVPESVTAAETHPDGDHYRVHIADPRFPTRKDIETEFGEETEPFLAWTRPLYFTDFFWDVPWRPVYSCEEVSETPGERVFFVKHFGHKTYSEDNVADMAEENYRPATLAEAFAFAKSYPDLQRQFPIVALGSIAKNDMGYGAAMLDGGYPNCAILDEDKGRRTFFHEDYDGRYPANYRFLFVRKEKKKK